MGTVDLKTMLVARFIAAIRASYTPCPLIGDKWFFMNFKVKPPTFQFKGLRKLGKATGFSPARVGQDILKNLDLKNLDLKGLNAEARREGDTIIVSIAGKPPAAKPTKPPLPAATSSSDNSLDRKG